MPPRARLDEKTAREMLQARLVSALFAKAVKHEFALKGGLAMRFAHRSMRYTKDVDVAADPSVPPDRVRSKLRAAIKQVMATGLLQDAKWTEPKQTDVTQRWKIAGRIGDNEIHLTVEVSRRDALAGAGVETVTYVPPREFDTGPIALEVYDLSAMTATKIACLLSPSREAPRDVYDLNLLITLSVEPPLRILRRYGAERLQAALTDLWDKLEKIDWNSARTNLLPGLPEAAASRFDEKTWDDMRLRTGQTVETWLKLALADLDEAAGPARRDEGPTP